MKIFIIDEQKAELEHFHDSSRYKRVCDRIKAVLLAFLPSCLLAFLPSCVLAFEGWASAMIAQALRLHETTVNQHINDYVIPANSSLKTADLQVGLMLSKKHF